MENAGLLVKKSLRISRHQQQRIKPNNCIGHIPMMLAVKEAILYFMI